MPQEWLKLSVVTYTDLFFFVVVQHVCYGWSLEKGGRFTFNICMFSVDGWLTNLSQSDGAADLCGEKF